MADEPTKWVRAIEREFDSYDTFGEREIRLLRILEAFAVEKVEADCARRRAAPTWQSIETAPKKPNGDYVLVALIRDAKVWRVSEARYNGLGWYDKGGNACHWRTHWMPLPLAPEAESTAVGASRAPQEP